MTFVVVSRVTFPILFHHANSAYELVVLWHNAYSIDQETRWIWGRPYSIRFSESEGV